MAVRAIGVSGEDPETIAAILTAYVAALRSALQGGVIPGPQTAPALMTDVAQVVIETSTPGRSPPA